jgi:hypothetical protein
MSFPMVPIRSTFGGSRFLSILQTTLVATTLAIEYPAALPLLRRAPQWGWNDNYRVPSSAVRRGTRQPVFRDDRQHVGLLLS